MRTHTRSRALNVLHVATINKPITPQMGYGPIEAVIGNIDKGLTSLGHRSIVACSADSEVTGSRYATVPHSLGDYLRAGTSAGQTTVTLHLAKALERARRGDIDVIHMHEWLERVYDRSFDPPVPIVMTLHVPACHSGIEKRCERVEIAPTRPAVQFVAISEYQRREYADRLTVAATVGHGIDVQQYRFQAEADATNYLFSIARITRVKGQDTAIEVARRSGSKLILAGCVQDKPDDRAFFEELKRSVDLVVDVARHPVNGAYYEQVMKPLLSCPQQIIYVGELDTEAKKHWYRRAKATLFPVRWGEPFGMVLIESMACGTPILAFREGAVPEIVAHGDTGLIVASLTGMIEGVERIDRIDRRRCRADVMERFSIQRMAEGYADLYGSLAGLPSYRSTPRMIRSPVETSELVSAS